VVAALNRRWICRAACLTLAGLTCACRTSSGPKSIDDPDPSHKIQAIVVSDESEIPKLIEQLDSDDSAVRFYAFDKLKRLTGETFGYQYFVDDDKRAAAVQQWKAWLKGWEAAKKPGGSK
jgi:hypothetical protein